MPSIQSAKRNRAPRAGAPIPSLVDYLNKMSLVDLRCRWLNAHPTDVLPKGLSRDLMVRGIAWQEQCSRNGGLAPATGRLLNKMAGQLKVSGNLEIERLVRPKTGTRILREWRGRTYVVEVAVDGFTHDRSKYASLSHVARAITGTRWSGPRFFGLKPEVAANGKGAG